MEYYCSSIPATLAWKLSEKGMPVKIEGHSIWCPSYAEVFDWFRSKKNIGINIKEHWSGLVYQGWDWQFCQFNKSITPYFGTFYGTWHETSNYAIGKAIEKI